MPVRKALLVLLLGLLLLPGCGGDGDVQVVTFRTFGDPAERDAYQTLVDAFMAQNPDVRIEVSHIPSPSEYRTRLVTDFAAEQAPDISLMNYRRFASFAANNLLEPIGPYLDESVLLDEADYYQVAIESFRWRGVLTCMPQNISSLVVYYNQDMFDAAGVPYPADDWTWDDFLATAQALTLDRDGDGIVEQYGAGIEPSLYRLSPFVWQNGGVVTNDPDRPFRLTLGRFPSLKALEWFVSLQTVHGVVPDRVAEASMDSESRFVNELTAMYFNSRRGTPAYREIEGFVWDVAPLPQGAVAAGILHSDGYCMSAQAENKGAAWRFIEFANSEEGQRIIVATGRTVPSMRSVAESDAFLSADQLPARSYVWVEAEPTLLRVPVMSTWEEIEAVSSQEIERAFYGDISAAEAARLAHLRTEEYFLLADFAVNPRP